MTKFIFSSTSPRRIELLDKLNLNIKTVAPHFEEKNLLNLSPEDTAEFNSINKAKSISMKYKDCYIFGADTVISYKNKTIGKPQNDTDALGILLELRNSFHKVITSLSLMHNNQLIYSERKSSLVKTTMISTDKIKEYISTGYYKDKAGGYGIQNKNFIFVDKYYGCYENILGLPTCLLKNMIKNFDSEKIINFSECIGENKWIFLVLVDLN